MIVLFSASQAMDTGGVSVFKKQLAWLVVAIVTGCVAAMVPLEYLRNKRLIMPISVLTVLALILVLIPAFGVEVNGARRWLGVGFFRFQVSEFAKLTLVLMLACYFSLNQRKLKEFLAGFVYPCILMGTVAGLILLEPDFGTAFLCGLVGVTLLFMAGSRLLYLLPSTMMALIVFGVAIFFDPVRLKRITSFMDVEGNKSDGAYQLWQGILAFGAGGLDGVGLGHGRQQLAFLPEAHTDFIFPIIGEELGLFFTIGVVFLFLFIFIVGILNMRYAPTLHEFTIASGSLFFLTYQALINVGVVTGCLPTKGMSLPFISYGGSNLIVMYAFVGLLLNCFRSWAKLPLEKRRDL
tara:strand:+ start:296 stop:1348 length:1053 start_codon:yes stop_codon:yes gene_type:complete